MGSRVRTHRSRGTLSSHATRQPRSAARIPPDVRRGRGGPGLGRDLLCSLDRCALLCGAYKNGLAPPTGRAKRSNAKPADSTQKLEKVHRLFRGPTPVEPFIRLAPIGASRKPRRRGAGLPFALVRASPIGIRRRRSRLPYGGPPKGAAGFHGRGRRVLQGQGPRHQDGKRFVLQAKPFTRDFAGFVAWQLSRPGGTPTMQSPHTHGFPYEREPKRTPPGSTR